jgi:hypothetical protein
MACSFNLKKNLSLIRRRQGAVSMQGTDPYRSDGYRSQLGVCTMYIALVAMQFSKSTAKGPLATYFGSMRCIK